MADIDKWIEIAKQCKYLPENDLKVNISVLKRKSDNAPMCYFDSIDQKCDVLVGDCTLAFNTPESKDHDILF